MLTSHLTSWDFVQVPSEISFGGLGDAKVLCAHKVNLLSKATTNAAWPAICNGFQSTSRSWDIGN